MPQPRLLLAIFVLLALTGFSVWSTLLVRPPEARPASALANEFSAERAMQYIRRIAAVPHAMGTPAHAQVRGYLVDEMRRLGLQPEVQERTVSAEAFGASRTGYVYNIIGRLKGRTAGKAVLLMAHYDSQPNTPGAADDGAGVAAILETARALRQGPPLQNDVIFLLTDGEEYGLFGASAFLRHRLAKDVGLVINLEARGNSGPSMTFEISPENGWVIEEFAKAAPYPFASSLMYEVYRALPNDTDFSVFREAGYTGVNSAFADGFVHYHKLTDSPDNLNQNSLQHHGDNMLALTRHFGTISLTQTKAPDKVFFNPAGSWLVQYPMTLNGLWIALVTGLLIGVLIAGLRRKAITLPQVLGGFLLYLVMLVIVAGSIFLINRLILRLLPYTHPFNGVYSSNLFWVAYLLVATGLFLLVSRLALRRLRVFSLTMGVYLLLYGLTLTLFAFVPSATFVFLFPLLFCLVGTLIVFVQNRHRQETSLPYVSILLIALLPAIFMLMPIVRLLTVIFALQLPVASVGLFLLVLGLAFPLLMVSERQTNWRRIPILSLLLLLAGVLQTVWAIQQEQPGPEHPLHSHVGYYLNADNGQAWWASDYQTTDDWNRQFFPNPTTGTLAEFYPMASAVYLKDKAQPIPVQPPVAQLISDSAAGQDHVLTIRLHSPRQAAHVQIVLLPQQESDVFAVTMNGERLLRKFTDTPEGPAFYILFNGLPVSKEVTLLVQLKKDSPLRLLLYDQSIGLPQQLVKTPMPAHVIPEQGRTSNITVVRKAYQF
ncbi:M20/M25/M40 family metallo-hydrolase [Nibrella saemangeumensis]|uniref:Vacuolar membrane protease n=1 Tax=Nibrella saemangeumensis TaxID=1084526 RepID=A0ABP8MS31_9BACT